jgi:hypothetical protein
MTPDEQLAEDMGRFYADPLGFVMYAYPWAEDKSLHICKIPEPWALVYGSEWGPDGWSCEFFEVLAADIRKNNFNGRDPVPAINMSVVSGHGIGKSAMVAWLVDFIMSTRPYAQGTVTANTAPQLSSKTWAQICKWTEKCITRHWFRVTTGRGSMRMEHKKHPASWFVTAQTCDEHNSEAFAGQHAANSTSFYIFDEASNIPDKIEEVSKGGLTDGEPMRFAFGNGTRNTGWFRETFRAMAHRWHNFHVDSREAQITNKATLQELIDDYGIDSDIVKVRVRGMFPSQSVAQFISEHDVDIASQRHLTKPQYEFAPKILTLDPAWDGGDELVFGLRQGNRFEVIGTMPKNDNDIVVATKLAQFEDKYEADAVFVDAGYGTGIVSAGRTWNRNWVLVWFGAAGDDPGHVNKRASMWVRMRDWLKDGGAIDPADHVLRRDLLAPETVARDDGKVLLESKKAMKARGQQSPNRADALALSFAFPVLPKKKDLDSAPMQRQQTNREYDPMEAVA